MCLAIYKPERLLVPEDYLEMGFLNNDDGAGVAFPWNGKIEVEKPFYECGKFIDYYRLIKDLPMLIHFRLATHGNKEKENVHPFVFADGKLALIHNGILDITSNTVESDTAVFVRTILEPLSKRINIMTSGPLQYLLSEAIGGYNKFCIMNGQGKCVIVNEKSGHWSKGIWYSNTSYEDWHYYSYANSQCYAGSSGTGFNTGLSTEVKSVDPDILSEEDWIESQSWAVSPKQQLEDARKKEAEEEMAGWERVDEWQDNIKEYDLHEEQSLLKDD